MQCIVMHHYAMHLIGAKLVSTSPDNNLASMFRCQEHYLKIKLTN